MTPSTLINRRRYEARHEAWTDLAARGFSYGSEGWRNGCWTARVGRGPRGVTVDVWRAC